MLHACIMRREADMSQRRTADQSAVFTGTARLQFLPACLRRELKRLCQLTGGISADVDSICYGMRETFSVDRGLVTRRDAMDQKNTTAELRIRIAKYRAMARLTTDQETARRIYDLAEELEMRLREMEGLDTDLGRGPN